MAHTLQLEIPEDIYNLLATTSEQTGQPLETLALEWLAAGGRDYAHDPMDDFIGAISSDVPGWGDRHDELIGEALMREMRGDNQGEN